MPYSTYRIAALAGLLLAAVGCDKDEAEVQREFREVVAENNACVATGDCQILSPGCPLGCWSAVSKKDASRVMRAARKLVDDYGGNCAYECPEAPPLVCEAASCVLLVPDADAGTEPDAEQVDLDRE